MPNHVQQLKKELNINLSLIRFYEGSRLPLKRNDAERLRHLKEKVSKLESEIESWRPS